MRNKTPGTPTADYRTPAQPQGFGARQFTRIFDNTYDFDSLSGFSFSTTPAGGWIKGQLYRQAMPAFVGPPAIGYYQWDKSDPNGWVTQRG
jgi:hypothetical protein